VIVLLRWLIPHPPAGWGFLWAGVSWKTEDRYIAIGELAHAAARAIEEMEETVWKNKKREAELEQLFEDLAGRG